MTKRKRFLAITLFLSLGLFLVQILGWERKFQAVGLLSFLAYFLSALALWGQIEGWEWLTVLPLSSLYTAGFGLFYFLLPEKGIFRLLIAFLYGLGIYALLLTENIFSVAATRTIQLLRAAQTVGFLIVLVTAFFLFDTLFSLRLPFWANSFFSFGLVFLLSLQSLWSVELKKSGRLFLFSFFISLVAAQVAFFLSFWPLSVALVSLFLTTLLYVLLGISQEFFKGRLFEKTLKEYLWVGVAVFLLTLYLSEWGR